MSEHSWQLAPLPKSPLPALGCCTIIESLQSIIYAITGFKFGFIGLLLAPFGKQSTKPWSDHHFVF